MKKLLDEGIIHNSSLRSELPEFVTDEGVDLVSNMAGAHIRDAEHLGHSLSELQSSIAQGRA